jgi:hypothetical protein
VMGNEFADISSSFIRAHGLYSLLFFSPHDFFCLHDPFTYCASTTCDSSWDSLVMRAAAKKHNINIVAVNDPFIPVDYSKCIVYFQHVLCAYDYFIAFVVVTHQTRRSSIFIYS